MRRGWVGPRTGVMSVERRYLPRMCAALRRVLWFFLPGWGTAESPRLDQDWRLRAAFDVPHGVADVFERLDGRERFLGSEVGGLLPVGVVLSRRDDALFVYASTRSGIDGARLAIEHVARAIGLSADMRVGRWDEGLREWRQVDPPLAGHEHELDDARAREANRQETRELSCLVGRVDRPCATARSRLHCRGKALLGQRASHVLGRRTRLQAGRVCRPSPLRGQVAELVYQPRPLARANPWLGRLYRKPAETPSREGAVQLGGHRRCSGGLCSPVPTVPNAAAISLTLRVAR
jgi:hypothetical protein